MKQSWLRLAKKKKNKHLKQNPECLWLVHMHIYIESNINFLHVCMIIMGPAQLSKVGEWFIMDL